MRWGPHPHFGLLVLPNDVVQGLELVLQHTRVLLVLPALLDHNVLNLLQHVRLLDQNVRSV